MIALLKDVYKTMENQKHEKKGPSDYSESPIKSSFLETQSTNYSMIVATRPERDLRLLQYSALSLKSTNFLQILPCTMIPF